MSQVSCIKLIIMIAINRMISYWPSYSPKVSFTGPRQKLISHRLSYMSKIGFIDQRS